jgi:uncharacterized protein (TIGR00661 family)
MSRLVYSLAGEGRGHAARARAIAEDVCREHEVTLLASGQAYTFLKRLYEDTGRVRVEWIPGLRFQYYRSRVNYWRSLLGSIPFALRLSRHVDRVAETVSRLGPDLAVSDFEPLLPRVAKRLGIPLISCDHQHFLVESQLIELPRPLRWQARFIGLPVRWFCSGQRETIVSSFFRARLKPQARHVTQIGVLIRPELLSAECEDDGRLLVYVRRAVPGLIEALRVFGKPARIYGLGCQPPAGRLEFRSVDETSFLKDLAACHAVVSTAGNQLLGEALFLGKPVLAIPEPGNIEQAINGHFLEFTGGGMCFPHERFSIQSLLAFLEAVPELRSRIDRTLLVGNQAARTILARHLPCVAKEPAWVA